MFSMDRNVEVNINFGGSGGVLSLMEISKKGDIYLPSSFDYMEDAIRRGIVYPETVKKIAYIFPVIIVNQDNPKKIYSLEDLARTGIRIAISDPETVSIGRFSVGLLKYNDLWEKIQKNIIVEVESFYKAFTVLTLGQVDATIGWNIVSSWNHDKAEIVYIEHDRIPENSTLSIAVSTYSQNRELAENFVDYLTSNDGKNVLREWGYILLEEEIKE
jgi:molybdate transport system substrate-binding protein